MLRIKSLILVLLVALTLHAERIHEVNLKLQFRQSKVGIDSTYMDNAASLRVIRDSIAHYTDSVRALRLRSILVTGAASPEGGIETNQWLSERRAQRIFSHIRDLSATPLPDSLTTFRFLGRDWQGTLRLAQADTLLPERTRVIEILRQAIDAAAISDPRAENAALERLKRLDSGRPYAYLLRRHFPLLRGSRITLTFEDPLPPHIPTQTSPEATDTIDTIDVGYAYYTRFDPALREFTPFNLYASYARARKPLYIALTTNLLLDLIALPNLGAEIYVGGSVSLAPEWTHGWWKSDPRARYWRLYGGSLTARYWWGSSKPLTAHHIGLTAGLYTYDFEWGGRGQLGGRPGGRLLDEPHLLTAVEYGYSLPIASRLNLDFTLGLGYIRGLYHEYTPQEGRYIWQVTKRRNYLGPTKAQISLVWLIGRGNTNHLTPRAK